MGGGNNVLESLLSTVSARYGFGIEKHEILHNSTRTQVVSLQTTDGSLVLKSINFTEDRLRFMLEAQEFLRRGGIAIPRVIPTRSGAYYIGWDGHLYFLQEKIQGVSTPAFSTEVLALEAALLGTMHAASRGFYSPFGPGYAGEYYWEKHYERKLHAISYMKERFALSHDAKKRVILENTVDFLDAGTKVLTLLQRHSGFQRWKTLPNHEHYLAHGDFHSENVLHTRDRLYLIDWEFARYDYPSKDINRLLDRGMKHDGSWNNASFEVLLRSYRQQHPLSEWQLQLLYLDLSFPYAISRFLHHRMYKNMTLEEVTCFLQNEREKTASLMRRCLE